MAFVVVQLMDNDDVVIISHSWLIDETTCKWPPYEDKILIKRAVLEKKVPESNWESHSIFILGVHKTYAGAKKEVDTVLQSDSDDDNRTQKTKKEKIQDFLHKENIPTTNLPTVVVVKSECLDCNSPKELVLVPDNSIQSLSASLEHNNINSNNRIVNTSNNTVSSDISCDILQTQQISSSRPAASDPKGFKSLKKFAIVNFIEESSVEVIPTAWLKNSSEAKWPKTDSPAAVVKYIQECKPAEDDWPTLHIKIYGYSNSFKKAKRKAVIALDMSSLDSDSSDVDTRSGRPSRKRQRPARYQSSEEYQSEAESDPSSIKMHTVPDESGRDDSDSQGFSREPQNLVSKENGTHHSMYTCLYNYVIDTNSKLDALTQKVDRLIANLETLTNFEGKRASDAGLHLEILKNFEDEKEGISVLHCLPPGVHLPVQTEDDLQKLNEKLKSDKDLPATMVRFLHGAASGKSLYSFVLNIARRVLSPDLAILFSRYGRKGKKSFMVYNETSNVILAAAALKFTTVDRETLSDAFGKALAGAADWNGRRTRPSDYKRALEKTCT